MLGGRRLTYAQEGEYLGQGFFMLHFADVNDIPSKYILTYSGLPCFTLTVCEFVLIVCESVLTVLIAGESHIIITVKNNQIDKLIKIHHHEIAL